MELTNRTIFGNHLNRFSQKIFIILFSMGMLFHTHLFATDPQWVSSNQGDVLYISPSSTKIGIGVEAPVSALEVDGTITMTGFKLIDDTPSGYVLITDGNGVGSWTSVFTLIPWQKNGSYAYYNSGNVGIGTSSPGTKLHLYSTSHNYLTIENNGAPLESEVRFKNLDGEWEVGINGGEQFEIQDKETGNIVFLVDQNTPAHTMVLKSSGNVGIGTNSPSKELDVNGDAKIQGILEAEEIIVEASGADFVFEDNYRLLPLKGVEQYIKQHRHLPDIPSAKEVEANGVSLGQMQTKLLQKIEELTLYMIDLKKENEVLKERVSVLEAN
jgi:hypothetical protein